MSRILFISTAYTDLPNGGLACSTRNLEFLRTLHGKDNVTPVYLKSDDLRNLSRRELIRTKIRALHQMRIRQLGERTWHRILSLLAEGDYDTCWFDSSTLGVLMREIRRRYPALRMIAFFLNVELDWFLGRFMAQKQWLSFPYWLPIIWRNESLTCRLADQVLCLTDRDASAIRRRYGRSPDMILPISLFHTPFSVPPPSRRSVPLQGLFVGSYFYGNIHGLSRFIRRVLPHTPGFCLTVIGTGMEKLRDRFSFVPNLKIHGHVDDLSPFYADADCVVLPISSGGGMKIKTAEALQHGKFILGTPEAFVGYRITAEEGCLCRSDQDFVQAIRTFNRPDRYNPASRALFERDHSTDALFPRFRALFSPAP